MKSLIMGKTALILGHHSIRFLSLFETKWKRASVLRLQERNPYPYSMPAENNSGCQTSLQCSYSELKEIETNSEEFKKYVTNETESHSIQQPTITDEQLKMMATYMTPAQLEEVKKSVAEVKKKTENQSYSTIKSSTITFNGKKYGPYKVMQRLFLTADHKNFFAIVGKVISQLVPDAKQNDHFCINQKSPS